MIRRAKHKDSKILAQMAVEIWDGCFIYELKEEFYDMVDKADNV